MGTGPDSLWLLAYSLVPRLADKAGSLDSLRNRVQGEPLRGLGMIFSRDSRKGLSLEPSLTLGYSLQLRLSLSEAL